MGSGEARIGCVKGSGEATSPCIRSMAQVWGSAADTVRAMDLRPHVRHTASPAWPGNSEEEVVGTPTSRKSAPAPGCHGATPRRE